MHRRLVRWFGVLSVLTMLAAACGDDGGEGATTSSSVESSTSSPDGEAIPSTTSPPLTASFRGVTADTIELGIAGVDFDELQAQGFVDFTHGDETAIWDALIGAVNDSGGILGRQLSPIYDFYLPVGNVEAEASCLYFTEDNSVFAVLGLWIGESVLCLTETHDTIHVGHLMRQEWIDRSVATLASPAMAEERELSVILDVLLSTGRLDGRTLGVLASANVESTVDSVVRPFVEANGLSLGTVGILSDSQGDSVAVDAEVGTFTERWKVDGVDFLLVVGNGGMNSIAKIRDGLGPIDVAVVDAETFQQIFGGVPEAERAGFDGVLTTAGLSPTNDEQFDEPLMHDCIETVEAAVPGLTVVPTRDVEGIEDWFAGIRDACASLAVFVAAATAAGPELTNDSFQTGLESLGSIDLPGQAFSSFGPGKHDGEDGFRLVAFDPTGGDEGSFIPLTDIVDTAAGT